MKKPSKQYHSTTGLFFRHSLLVNSLMILIPLLLVGTYTIVRTARESYDTSRRNAALVLGQADDLLDTFYTHVDNAYLFFNSNPRASQQLKKAFAEKTLSLSSIQSLENLSLNFQSLIYTQDYLRNILIYYKNDYHRIFVPLSGRLMSFSPDNEAEILSAYDHAGDADVWMELSDKPLLYTDYRADNLFIYRKLYRRTTDVQNGLILFSFSAEKILAQLHNFLEYPEQQIFLVDTASGQTWPGSDTVASGELLELASAASPGQEPVTLTGSCIPSDTVTCLHSPRSYGFTYVLLTPKRIIYQTTYRLCWMYIAVMVLALAVAWCLAYLKTRQEYKNLNEIIAVLSSPESAPLHMPTAGKRGTNPFTYILMNVIQLFIQQDYLKMQDSEKASKLQLSKMQTLQHQINPHFLHNTLNIIYWNSVKLTGSENECSKMISDLSALMRYSLSDPQENVTLRQEFDYLEKYLGIMSIRYPGRFSFSLQAAPGCEDALVKKMLLQPLVENAIYHGIKEKAGSGVIRVTAHLKKDRLYIGIYDTGIGIAPAELAALQQKLRQDPQFGNEHIGLANTNSRLLLSYGEPSRLHMQSRFQRFTAVWFSVPLQRAAPQILPEPPCPETF